MRIQLSPERRAQLSNELRGFMRSELDRELSEFHAQRLIDFFAKRLGARVYNQAIQDARRFFQDKLGDLEGEFYEPEEAFPRKL
jgi:uncharacterized protein (DUF2164 family)